MRRTVIAPFAAVMCTAFTLAVSAVAARADTLTTTTTTATATTTACESPQIEAYPQSQTVTAGHSATFGTIAPVDCFTPTAVIGTAEWQVSTDGGQTFSLVAGSTTPILSSGSDGTSLTVPDTTVSMSGFEYRAVLLSLTGAAFLAPPPATLTVLAPETTTTTTSATTTNAATFSQQTTTSSTTTSSTTGAGGVSAAHNVVPAKLTRAQKLDNAIKACDRRKAAKKRHACVAVAKKRYAHPKPTPRPKTETRMR